MNTKILEYMIAIAEERSVSKAAERYYLAQPVLSKHLKNIEADIGMPLFIRSHGEMKLTEAGIIYINNARAILHVEQQLNDRLKKLKENDQIKES